MRTRRWEQLRRIGKIVRYGVPLETLYSQLKNLGISLGLSSVDPLIDLYIVSKTDVLLRDTLNSWSSVSRSRYVRLVHLLEEAPTYDTIKAWRQLLKAVVWKQCKHLLISPTIRTKVSQNIDLIAQKCKEIGDLFPTYATSRDLDEPAPTPLLDIITFVKTLDWQDCLEVSNCITTYLLDLQSIHAPVDIRRGVIPLVLDTMEEYADKCIGNIDFLFTTYVLSRFYRYKKEICDLMVQPTPLDNLLWEATWNPSFEATSGDLVNAIRNAIYEIVVNYYIKENCPWIFVGCGPAFVAHYIETNPTSSASYISLMNFAYCGSLLVTKHYLQYLGTQLQPLLTTLFDSYPAFETYLRDINITYTLPPTIFNELVSLWTTPITTYKFTSSEEAWDTLMLLIWNEVLKPLEQTSSLVDIYTLFTLISTLMSFTGSEADWKDTLRFFIECCYWDGTEEKYNALTSSLWMYLSGKLEMRTQTNEYDSEWLTIWTEFATRSTNMFMTKVGGEVYNKLRELYNRVHASYENAKAILPTFYSNITKDIVLNTAIQLQRILDSMMWDVDVPTLMDNIRSYTMYNSITLTPQQQQKLLDVMTIAVNKRLYDDRESLEALVDDHVLLNILVQMSSVLESYSNYIQDLKRHIVKSAVADLSAVLEHQINNTQSSLYQSLNNIVVASFPTLKSARDEIYTNPSDVSKLQKFEQTKTRILKDCVTTTCTTLTPTLQNHFTPDSLRDYSKGRVTSPTLLRSGDRVVNDIVRTMYSPTSIKTYSTSIDNSSLRDVSSSMLRSYSQTQSVIFDIFRLPNGVLSSVSGAIGSISTIIGTSTAFSTLPLAVVRNVSSLISNTFSTVSAAERTIMNMMNLPTIVLNNVQSTINNVQGLVTQISGLGTNLLSNFEKLNDIVSPIQRTIPDFDLLCSEFSIHPSDSNLSSILQSFADCPSCFLGGDPPTNIDVQNLLNKFVESRKTGSYIDNEYAYNAELLG